MSIAQALAEMERAREMLVLSTRLKCVLNLMEITGWPVKRAIEALKISENECDMSITMLNESKN